MRIRFNPLWLLVSALVFPFQFCHAQVVVPPVVSFDLGGTNAPDTDLWDMTGLYNLNLTLIQRNNLEQSLAVSFNLTQDAKGNLSGPTNEVQELDLGANSFFAVTYLIKGKITGSGGMARVHFTIHFTGNGQLAGQQVDNFKGSLTVDAETDPTSGQLMGGTRFSKFSASFGHFPGVKGIADFSTPFPAGVDGTWNLSMQIAALNKISGSAIITTPSEAFGFGLSGSFKNSLFKIQAKGMAGVPSAVTGVGSSAAIVLPTTFDTIQLKGKLLGQKMVVFFPED